MWSSRLRYGAQGFTDTPEIRGLLEPYAEDPWDAEDPDSDDLIHFNGLPWHEAERLLRLLPEQNARDRQNAAPRFEQFIDLGREFSEIRFHGYRVTARRCDERVTIEGYFFPAGARAEELFQRMCAVATEPDCYGAYEFEGRRMMRAWWD